MKTALHLLKFYLISTLLSVPFFTMAQTLGDAENLPFTINLEEVTQPSVPGLHSFALGKVDDWWAIIGGRTNGLHGFFITTGFPDDEANSEVMLIQPTNGTVHRFPVEDLALPFPDALRATNPQYAQDGDWLYITGGYGKDLATEQFRTFPVLTAVDLPLFKEKMLNGENPTVAFRQVESVQMKVCGGEMEKLGDWFYLVGGHDFSGLYNQTGPPQFTQQYTNEIRRFKIMNTPTLLAVTDLTTQHDESNLHRRDFTMAPVIRPDGSEGICLYGGVFRPDADLPFYHPIYIDADGNYEMDANYEQLFSQYTCPAVPLFDSLNGSMYTLLFAGLSTHYWGNGLQYDEKVPFINDISTFHRRADGTSLTYLMPQQFDELLGANMVFVPSETAPHFANEVLHLQQMSGTTFVGYLFGGIKAEIPNLTPSSASNRLFKLYVTPRQPSASTVGQELLPQLRVYPNPFSDGDLLKIEASQDFYRVEVWQADGRMAAVFEKTALVGYCQLKNCLSGLLPGIYYLRCASQNGQSVVRVFKQ